jgi:alpha-glucoside transport system permease protein
MKRLKKNQGAILVNLSLAILVFIWLIPTFGLFVSSFRDRLSIQTTQGMDRG